MRTFVFKIIEETDGDVRIDMDFGDPATASIYENNRADLLQFVILKAISTLENIVGSGHGDSPEEARKRSKIESDIRKAGEPK